MKKFTEAECLEILTANDKEQPFVAEKYHTDLYNWYDLVEKALENVKPFITRYWDNYGNNYPNNLYTYGVYINGQPYTTGYTGVAGRYWEGPNDGRWMKGRN